MVEKNNVVLVDYTVRIDGNDDVIDTSEGRKPLAFVVGNGQVISKLDSDVIGKDDGYSVDLVIAPDDAYGEYDEKAFETLPREQFAGIELEEGQTLLGSTEDGGQVQVIVSKFDDKEVVIDYNHPLAGKTLNFSYTIVSHRDATKEEKDGAFLVENSVESDGASCCSTDKGDKESSSCCGGGDKGSCGCK